MFNEATDCLRIELATLGDNSGVLGAAHSIISKLNATVAFEIKGPKVFV